MERSWRSSAFRAARRRQRLHRSCGNSRSSASPGWNGRGRPSWIGGQFVRCRPRAQADSLIRAPVERLLREKILRPSSDRPSATAGRRPPERVR